MRYVISNTTEAGIAYDEADQPTGTPPTSYPAKLAVWLYTLTGKRKKMYDNPYHLFEYTTGTLHKLLAKHFSRVVIVNNIKKPSELNMKNKSLEYTVKRLVHYVNYPFTKMFNRNGDRLLVLAYK